ncbi:hypothetical protein ACFP6B_09780 [Rothia nasimurium]|uniref:hypothetical protein n=1 Tax=Rothia nasimurium TaxID=85336 RepID=UPI0036125C9E
MTTFEDMLKKRPIDPEILEEKVRKMEEEARAYEDMAPDFNADAQARRAFLRKRPSGLHAEE